MPVVTAQRRLNCYYERRDDGDKTRVAIIGTPGMALEFTLSAPPRGLLPGLTSLYAVVNDSFLELTQAGVTLGSGTLSTATGNVSIARSPSQVVTVDGSDGWTWESGALTQITSAGFPNGAQTVVFVGGYFVCESPGSQQFFVSDSFDAMTWNALAFASASQYPGQLVAVDGLTGNLLLMCSDHLEFWQNVGATPEPFQPILSATSEYGLAAIWSRAHVANALHFLSTSQQGGIQVCRVTGYLVEVISTPDIDRIMGAMDTVSDAEGNGYVVGAHGMYQLTFPTENRTFLFDSHSGLWSEMQSGVPTGDFQRHKGQWVAALGRKTFVTDYSTGAVCSFSETTYTDNGDTIVREVVTRHVNQDYDVATIDELYLDMETGVGLSSGQGSDPQIMCQVSKDNGHTWQTERWVALGAMGNYFTRVIWRTWGSARDFVFRFRMTDPVKFVITEGALKARGRAQ